MKRMRQFLIALGVVWTAACIAAYLYSSQQNIPASLAAALLPAFLIEIALYLAPGFQAARRWFERLGSTSVRAGLLTAGAAIPFVVATMDIGAFNFPKLCLLLALAGVASFWYVALKKGALADLAFLLFMAAVYMSRVFGWIYPQATPRLPLDILGHLMWIRVGIMSILSIRGFENINFGFLPSRNDWRTGVQSYLFFLPIAAIAGYALNYLHFHALAVAWWKYTALAVLTFAGMLWVVAAGEEFFFRGFLQQTLAKRLHSEIAGLIVASLLFGLAHLPFRSFPNWPMVALASILGLFCGLAVMRARSIRAAMVTHALAATTFRLFFST
jgi:membrane protease YdiL (CAAX protease family)